MRSVALLVIAWSIGVATVLGPVQAETTPAVVAGAELLYVRRGAGTGFPAFATIEKGERVEVERLEGVWALVRLASGQSGYVHSTFLSFPGQPPAKLLVIAAPTPVATPTATPTATMTPDQRATELMNRQREEQVQDLREQLAAAQEPSVTSAQGDSGSDLTALRADVHRLSASVDALHKRLDLAAYPAAPQEGAAEHSWSSPAVGLLVLMALLLGWVVGGAYGRQSERSRRHRIRF